MCRCRGDPGYGSQAAPVISWRSRTVSRGWRPWGERSAPVGPGPPCCLARMGLAYQTGRYVDRLGIADELLALAHDQESSLMAEAMLRPLIAVHLSWGDFASARAVLAEGLRMAHQIGVPAIETFQSTLLATADMLAGDWETALRRTFNAHDLARTSRLRAGGDLPARCGSHLLVRLGRLDEAADRVSEGQRLFGKWSVADRHVFALIDLAEGMVALAERTRPRSGDRGCQSYTPPINPAAGVGVPWGGTGRSG